ncbi:MAG: PspC domain-containing protein [Tepidisphaeraceae bacterium]
MDFKDFLNRLGRSRDDAILGGVCGGFAETTDTPAWVWRLVALFALLWGGTGGLLYLVLWLLMPYRRP